MNVPDERGLKPQNAAGRPRALSAAPGALKVRQTTDTMPNMKTIAVTVDEATLNLLDELTDTSPRFRNRSALVRTALREFAERERRRVVEAKDGALFQKHRARLARQARLLVAEQARL